MRVLWLCNIMLPVIGEHFGWETTNKEGWLSGLADTVLGRRADNGIELAIAYPAPKELLQKDAAMAEGVRRESVGEGRQGFLAYGFRENTAHPEIYEEALEAEMKYIIGDFKPELVHCFGTEYPHTLAMCRVFPDKSRLLVGIQGLCAVYANAYFADLPDSVRKSVTFRDRMKRDSLILQQKKFVKRGEMEKEALALAGNITGRTEWDAYYAGLWNPAAKYYFMNETIRQSFYEGEWREEESVPHLVFLSQGDYPIKGLHYMLLAMPRLLKKYPDMQLAVAGNSLVQYESLKDKLKLSAYGRYLRSLLKKGNLWERVSFLGRLNAEEMKRQYLKSHLFVCCSSIENSPNSLGEAMLLGVPCISADVGGIPTIFHGGEDGILYRGFHTSDSEYDREVYFAGKMLEENKNNNCNDYATQVSELENNVDNLVSAIDEMWSNPKKMHEWRKNARNHAAKTHEKEKNYNKMKEIYASILSSRDGLVEKAEGGRTDENT